MSNDSSSMGDRGRGAGAIEPVPGGPAMPYVPVDGSPWRLSMGLHRLDPSQWLEVDGRRAADLRAKAGLLDGASRADVLAELPGSEHASRELFDLVVSHLASGRPDLVTLEGHRVREHSTGIVVDAAGQHPVEAASRLTQEDLCVLEHDEREWRLTAACVCFPSRWHLPAKIGQTLSGIHEPVPGFEDQLAHQSSVFFDRLAVERPVWRLNWTLLDTPELHLPSPASRRRSDAPPGDVGESMWFRVERQTLRRLEASDAIVFTIRTYVTSLAGLVAIHDGAASRLAETLRTVPDDVAAYKGWTAVMSALLGWLDSVEPAGTAAR